MKKNIVNLCIISSSSMILLSGCTGSSPYAATQTGAATGAIAGAVIGGNTGSGSGSRIATGAALGALAGGGIGYAVDSQNQLQPQTGGWQ